MPKKTSLTANEAADRLGISTKWLRALVKLGLPREKGRGGKFPWPGIREWYNQHLERKFTKPPTKYADERAAYMRVRRELVEIELKERQREVVRIEDVRRIWGQFLDKLRAILLNLPATMAPRVVGVKTVRQAMAQLDEGVREILSLLQTVGNEYRTPEAEKKKRNRKVKRGRNNAKNLRTS